MEATTKVPPQHGAKDQAQAGPQKPGPQAAPPDSLDAILERARQGDKSVLPQLKKILDEHPSLWQDCYQLVSMSEQAWLDKIAGADLRLSQSVRRYVEQMKRDLAGPSPSPLEKLLAERIAGAWLGVHHAEMAEAFGDTSGGKLAQARLQRLESANRRFLAAAKALAVTRRLTSGLKIEINHTHNSPGTNRSESNDIPREASETGKPDAVRDRLKDFFKEGSATVEKVAAGATS